MSAGDGRVTATDELRRMLDENSVSYESGGDWFTTWSSNGTVFWEASEYMGYIEITGTHLTPTQAIEATLGRGTCKMVVDNHHRVDKITTTWGCVCSACGSFHKYSRGEGWKYCPTCGAKVVDG